MTLEAIASALGGPQALKHPMESGSDLIAITRSGIPASILTILATNFVMDRRSIAATLGISPRTLSRRLRHGARLTAEESDRAVRMARILAMARSILDSPEKAAAWLKTPNRALDGVLPYSLLDTDAGAQAVETLLGRIAYGVYS